jgi:hypothetical protein
MYKRYSLCSSLVINLILLLRPPAAPPIPTYKPAAPPIQPTPAPPIQPTPPLERTVTIAVTEEVRKELVKIGAEYTSHDGVIRNLQEVIELLIVEHKQALSK